MGKLYIVPTPIGNLEDITFRAVRILKEVDHILCEDTRVSKKLLDQYQINTPLISYRDQNHKKLFPKISALLSEGIDLAIISDAGTPSISDPGFKLIKELVEIGVEIIAIPGPSSVISSLVTSGYPTDKFIYLGFLPKSSGKREKILKDYLDNDSSLVIFESPYRLIKLLDLLLKIDNSRYIAVVNDQTKMYEKVWRGMAGEIVEELKEIKLKGEFVVIVAKKGFEIDLPTD